MSLKADDRNVVPLCMHHHQMLHVSFGNEEKFFEAHGRSSDYGKKLAEALYQEAMNLGFF